MYQQVAEKMIVSSSATSFTDFVEMTDANAVQVDFELLSIPAASSIRYQVEQGNDLENWKTVGSPGGLSGVGFESLKVTGIGGRFVRLRAFFNSGSGTAVVILGLATKKL